MTPINYTIEDQKSNRCYYWKADSKADFRSMRAFLYATNTHLDSCFGGRLANVLDDIREMPVGETKYCVCSAWDCYTGKSLEDLSYIVNLINKSVERGEIDKQYGASGHGFSIRRTAKRYIYRPLNA